MENKKPLSVEETSREYADPSLIAKQNEELILVATANAAGLDAEELSLAMGTAFLSDDMFCIGVNFEKRRFAFEGRYGGKLTVDNVTEVFF